MMEWLRYVRTCKNWLPLASRLGVQLLCVYTCTQGQGSVNPTINNLHVHIYVCMFKGLLCNHYNCIHICVACRNKVLVLQYSELRRSIWPGVHEEEYLHALLIWLTVKQMRNLYNYMFPSSPSTLVDCVWCILFMTRSRLLFVTPTTDC